MEPVTHLLTGACLSRTGLNRRAAYATLTMVIAAEFPDIDTLWSLRGPVEGFQHHRGITHTFLGLPFEAALIVAAVYGWHRWRLRRARGRGAGLKPLLLGFGFRGLKPPAPSGEQATTNATATATATTNTGVLPFRGVQGQDDGEKQATANAAVDPYGMTSKKAEAGATARAATADPYGRTIRTAEANARVKPLTVAPVRWGVLYGLALLALLSHLLLDYMNNYGLRPFFPFNDRWYAASIEFIFDPVMFVLLLGALIAPWLFGLVGSEVGAKKQPFRARGWAIAALLGVAGWWGLREVEHARAVQLAMAQSMAALPVMVPDPSSSVEALTPTEPTPTYLSAQQVLASPDPLSPFRWSAVTDFGPLYQLSEIDTLNGSLTAGDSTYPKPGRSPTVLAAEESKLGRAYMDWSPMPFVEVTKPDSELAAAGGPGAVGEVVVTFRDPRFMGGWMRDAGRSALVGTVTVDAAGRVVSETMDGRVEK